MEKIVVDDHFCKGCGLCVDACPAHIMQLDTTIISAKGYHPARCTNQDACTSCMSCATMCPDVAISVYK